MAFRIVWTRSARKDLKAIVQYIKTDNPRVAENFGLRLIKDAEDVAVFPRRGRVLREENNPLLREIICNPYRIVYQIEEKRQVIYIVRIWHSARGKPEL